MYLSNEQRVRTRPYRSLPPYRVETLLEQGSGPLNEDVLLINDNLFGVFDGATSISHDDLPAGVTGGLIAAKTAAETFRQQGDTLLGCAKEANRRINRALGGNNISGDQRYRLWSTSAAVIRLEDDHFDYCQTGDSLILLIYKDGSYTNLTPDINHDSETLRLWKDTQVPDGITIHEALKEKIRNVRLEMNVTYGVLNGEPEAIEFIRHGRMDLNGVSSILVFTDGLFLPREDPEQENDWSSFVDMYRQTGIKGIYEYVRTLHDQDPYCRKYPRFKRHDDAAAIAVTV